MQQVCVCRIDNIKMNDHINAFVLKSNQKHCGYRYGLRRERKLVGYVKRCWNLQNWFEETIRQV